MKDNITKLPVTGDESENLVVDFTDIDPETAEKIFDVMDLLSNRKELIKKFTPLVLKFLENEDVFNNTTYKNDYDLAFIDFVVGLIKDELVSHFDFTPEEILILTESDFIDLITEGFYFNKNNYKGAKDGEHENSLH